MSAYEGSLYPWSLEMTHLLSGRQVEVQHGEREQEQRAARHHQPDFGEQGAHRASQVGVGFVKTWSIGLLVSCLSRNQIPFCSDEPILRASEVQYYLTAEEHQRIRRWKLVVVGKLLVDHVPGLSTCRRWIRWVWCSVV